MALGVALSVNSGLGVSPINSLPYVLSQILQVDMGSCVTGVFCAYTIFVQQTTLLVAEPVEIVVVHPIRSANRAAKF